MVHQFGNLVRSFGRDESGATAIEYSLIAVIVSVGIVASLPGLRDSIDGLFQQVLAAVQNPG
ncbi:Flp family type IVb pilin [Flaviflagellibacter deserti]|jgi:pilus assembly protein Flp/PilA|uniref:Flp family type IVb pilin n=1 Tax=Flaviflagellibacter deserti TaxID=2267266 RepID=A0ABV9YX89_9HYPH